MSSLPFLSFLILDKVLINLSVKEKLRCKIVCKDWKQMIESHANIITLCIYDDIFPVYSSSSVNRFIGLNNSFKAKNLKLLLSFSAFENLRSLKRLYIYFNNPSNDLMFNSINLIEFTRLEELEVDCKQFHVTEINLPNLKQLTLKEFFSNGQMQMDTPNLEELIIFKNFNYLTLKYPEKIKYLKTNVIDSSVKQLNNLETLACLYFSCIDTTILVHLPKLKQITIGNKNPFQFAPINILNELIRQKANLKRDDLRIDFVCFDKYSHIPEFQFFNYENASFHYLLDMPKLKVVNEVYTNLINNLPFEFQLHYTSLIQSFTRIPHDFCDKFSNIKRIHLDSLFVYNDLIQFLKKNRYLTELFLNLNFANQLSCDLLNQLSIIVPHLTFLKLNARSWSMVNYNFLNKLHLLQSIEFRYAFLPLEFLYFFINRSYNYDLLSKFSFIGEVIRLEFNFSHQHFSYSELSFKTAAEMNNFDCFLDFLKSHKYCQKILLDRPHYNLSK